MITPIAASSFAGRSVGQSRQSGGHRIDLQKRFAQGFSILAHYTWSKTLDTGGTGSGSAFTEVTSIQNIDNIRAEWPLSTQDVPQRFQFTWQSVISGQRSKAVLSALPLTTFSLPSQR